MASDVEALKVKHPRKSPTLNSRVVGKVTGLEVLEVLLPVRSTVQYDGRLATPRQDGAQALMWVFSLSGPRLR